MLPFWRKFKAKIGARRRKEAHKQQAASAESGEGSEFRDTSSTRQTFHPFNRLPPELRFHIYSLSFSPRSVELGLKLVRPEPHGEVSGKLCVYAPRWRKYKPRGNYKTSFPALLHVNSEARAYTRSYYTLMPGNYDTSTLHYVNFSLDIICIQGMILISALFEGPPGEDDWASEAILELPRLPIHHLMFPCLAKRLNDEHFRKLSAWCPALKTCVEVICTDYPV